MENQERLDEIKEQFLHDGDPYSASAQLETLCQKLIDENETAEAGESVAEVNAEQIIDAGMNVFGLQLFVESLARKKDAGTFKPFSFVYRKIKVTLAPAEKEKKSDGLQFTKHLEPVLIPEWKPKEGEWVMNEPGSGVQKWAGWDLCLGDHPLSDKERIDICDGIDNLRRIVEEAGGG